MKPARDKLCLPAGEKDIVAPHCGEQRQLGGEWGRKGEKGRERKRGGKGGERKEGGREQGGKRDVSVRV